ncbi:MAG: PdxA family dehydrogenase [Gemmatimonadaceae bacterium]
MRPRLAVTAGDPRGIGPEIIRRALDDPRVVERCDVLVVAPEGVGLGAQEQVGEWRADGGAELAGALSGSAIERAVSLALAGEVQGIVTAPIDKAALLAGGFDYPGHTEMLGALTGSEVAMMLTSTDAAAGKHPLRVVLATTHLALRDVPAAVTPDAIARAARITRQGLTDWFSIADPRIALCALNPHGGDGRRFGEEDEDVLAPAAHAAGIAGPYPADTVFVRAMKGEFDAVIAPYHDVGMTAIKVASFGSAVNVTLGLPFPRTSPDHGTALAIAGRGIADPSSFIQALLLCATLADRARSRGDRPVYEGPPPASRSGGRPSPGR